MHRRGYVRAKNIRYAVTGELRVQSAHVFSLAGRLFLIFLSPVIYENVFRSGQFRTCPRWDERYFQRYENHLVSTSPRYGYTAAQNRLRRVDTSNFPAIVERRISIVVGTSPSPSRPRDRTARSLVPRPFDRDAASVVDISTNIE